MKKFKFIGIGGAINTELGGNCCYLKEDGNLLIIDACEEATKRLIKEKAFDDIKDVYIAITHTHYDHVAGLGVIIWYCGIKLGIIPHIIYNDNKYKKTLKDLFKVTGVTEKCYKFIHEKNLKLNYKVNMQPTTHAPYLQCFGIMFEDKAGKYYYSGDTNDIDYIRKLSGDKEVKKIYCEVSEQTFDVHIKYDDLKDLDRDKLILMHFNTAELYRQAIKEGFTVAKKIK